MSKLKEVSAVRARTFALYLITFDSTNVHCSECKVSLSSRCRIQIVSLHPSPTDLVSRSCDLCTLMPTITNKPASVRLSYLLFVREC